MFSQQPQRNLMDIVPIKFYRLNCFKTYACIILGNSIKQFAIYIDLYSGLNIETILSKKEKKRPFTHDLISSIFLGLDISIKQVIINDNQNDIFFSRIVLEQKKDDLLFITEIDARPSDSIALSLMYNAPLFCHKIVLEKSIAFVE